MTEAVRAVDRALDVLLCFTAEHPNLTLTQISERIGIHKSTVHRLLGTLESKRFVERDEATGSYHLGLGLVEMAYLVLHENNLQRMSRPYLVRLADEYRETVDLAVLDGTEVTYIQVIEGHERVKIAAAPGGRLPAFCTASGKAFLANLPPEQVREVLANSTPRRAPNTITTPDALYAELRVTRERGFAISEQEYEENINAVSAPILNAEGHPVAAIAIAGPSFRLTRERMLALGPAVRAAADAIARDLGHSAVPGLPVAMGAGI